MKSKIGDRAVSSDPNGIFKKKSYDENDLRYLTVGDVAHRYQTSINTIWRWARTRAEFPQPVKLGPSCTRWRLDDLKAFEVAQAEAAQ